MKKLLQIASVVCLLALSAFGQTLLTTTTLSAAITSSSATKIVVASATGITAGSTVLYIADSGNSGEAVFVNSVSGTTIGVTRDYQTLGAAAPHASGTVVFVGPAIAFSTSVQPNGSCTRTSIGINNNYLPVIAFGLAGQATTINDCIGGQWVSSLNSVNANTFAVFYAPNTGAVDVTSINSTGTTLAATTMYCTEIDLQQSKYATGLTFLLGTVGGTDKHIAVLYDGTGNLIANSATAGTTAGTASTYEQLPFTSKYYMVGPAKYYGCLQTNGTTATVRMLVTHVLDSYTTKGVTGQTFGTIPATITVPTTFTTAVGPYEQVY